MTHPEGPQILGDVTVIADTLILVRGSGLPAQNWEDVQNTMLLATLAANKKFPEPGRDIEKWYAYFSKVLSDSCAWKIHGFTFDKRHSQQTSYTLDQVAASELKLDKEQQELIDAALDRLKEPLEAVSPSTTTTSAATSSGSFTIGYAELAPKNSVLHLKIVALRFTAKQAIHSKSIFHVKETEADVWVATGELEHLANLYKRDDIKKKLGKLARHWIERNRALNSSRSPYH